MRAIGAGNQVDDVQTAGIRSVADGWALVPARSMQTGSEQAAGADVLCLTDGEAVGCAPADGASTTGVGLVSATTTRTNMVGLVPDRVSSVRFTPTDGDAVTSSVSSNFFALSVPETAPERTIEAPSGYEGGSEILAPPAPAGGTVQWLDGNGDVVGPAAKAVGG